MTKVAVTGSTGLIGTALVASLRADGHEVVRLVRRAPQAPGEVRWDPRSMDAGLGSAEALHGVTACVHLAGAGVAGRRWTKRYKAEVKASRVLGTRALATALARLDPLPAVLVSASAIGFYGSNTGADEQSPAGSGFLPGVVREWEAAADPARSAGIRVVHPRSGLVMSADGGVLAKFLPLARPPLLPVSLCPRFGSGTQFMSWISLTDEIRAIRFLIDQDIAGPVNLTAPSPVTNAAFAQTLSKAIGRRDLPWLRVPAPVLRLGMGEASVELLSSSRVSPTRLAEHGFDFLHPTLTEALTAELTNVGAARVTLRGPAEAPGGAAVGPFTPPVGNCGICPCLSHAKDVAGLFRVRT
jgi:uncharacterized protein (TIGR01777 family)